MALTAIEAAADYGYDFPAASLRYRMAQARQILTDEVEEARILQRLYEEISTGMETIEMIPSAFAVIELAQGDPLKAAQLSASIGWDTDTIGAISDAICGGMHPEKISQTMIQQIETVNDIDFQQLTAEVLPYVKG